VLIRRQRAVTRALVGLAVVPAIAACDVSPSSPLDSDIGVRRQSGVTEVAIRLCPDEELSKLEVFPEPRSSGRLTFKSGGSETDSGLTIIRLVDGPTETPVELPKRGTILFRLDTRFEDGSDRRVEVETDLLDIPDLERNMWLNDSDNVVSASALKARGC